MNQVGFGGKHYLCRRKRETAVRDSKKSVYGATLLPVGGGLKEVAVAQGGFPLFSSSSPSSLSSSSSVGVYQVHQVLQVLQEVLLSSSSMERDY